MEYSGSYNIGLDIGTNSLGWAVADNNGSLIKYKKKPMCGTVLIQMSGQTAAVRRSFRSARRRLARKRQRIQWIQELMGPVVLKDDLTFFERLKYSYVSKKDESCTVDPSLLFDNSYYKTHEYFKEFPTIYHLRKRLIETDNRMDIRLVYLAVHHIIKYRGNFLYEGQTLGIDNLNVKEAVIEMLEAFEVLDSDDDTSVADDIEKVLKEKTRKNSKRDDLANLLEDYAPQDMEKPKVWAKALAGLILGYSTDVSVLFGLEESKKLSFADESYIEAEDLLDDYQTEQFESMQKVYSAQVLLNILSGDSISTLSDAYIAIYEKHEQDLRKLKDLLRKYCDLETFKRILDKGEVSYKAYVEGGHKCTNEILCKTLKTVLNGMPQDDEDVISCLSDIEDGTFLVKPRNSNNGAIPNQLHVEELEKIIDNQARFYPELKVIKAKLVSIAEYRIPYFVGPLSKDSPFSWVVRDEKQKIYPWNFNDVVDANKTAQAFIRRMTNKCSYLIGEDVLPKESILYSEYTVLDELSNVLVDGHRLAPDCKMDALNSLFKKHKTVSSAMFRNWYKTNYHKEVYVSGLSDNKKFQSNMRAYVDLTGIIGPLDSDSKLEEAEKIIELITLFQDRKIRESQIREFCPDLSDRQVNAIMKLSYAGWGRFSRKLLNGVFSSDGDTVIERLRNSSQNFMQIMFNKNLNFEEAINKANLSLAPSEEGSIKDFIMEYPGSPAIKKTIWTAIKVVDEIQSIIGHAPSNIYIEVASGDEKKKVTSSRYKKLSNTYSKIDDEIFKETFAELKKFKDNPKALDRRALFLYFLQNGKCLYSGKSLSIAELSLYQIDHILPRCYIKDDSIDNLALVIPSENQRKLDSLVLSDRIIDSQSREWDLLYKNGLMSRKKYDNLRRRSVDDKDIEGFINRQLVETRQICTNVFRALKIIYNGKVPVYGVSAKLTYNLKQKINLPKIRELNDYHHAVDAYTAILAGNFSQKWLSVPRGELNQFYRQLIAEVGPENRQVRYGIIAELFYSSKLGWNGPVQLMNLLNCSKRHDFYVNCLTEEISGEFYNQTLMGKGTGIKKLIPRKNNMPTEIYGGYTGNNDAYFCIVEDKSKPREKALSLIGVPVRVVALKKQNPDAVIEYFKSIGIAEPYIIKDRIKKYQHILYPNGNAFDEFYMVGAREVINAKQLWLSAKSTRTLNAMLHSNQERKNDVLPFDVEILYDELCERISKYYPCFRKLGDDCEKYKEVFMALPYAEKIKHIKNMLTVTKANSSRVEKWERTGVDGKKIELKTQRTRFNDKTLESSKIIFIDSSITGMRSRRYAVEF